MNIQIKTNPKELYEVLPCDRSEVKEFIETHHYSKNINGLKISQCFKVLNKDNELVGGVVFGELSTTAWKKFSKNEKDVVELRRLVLLDNCVFNSESYVIAKCLKWLKKNTSYKIVVSYADPHHNHSGTIYKASNFEYVGKTASDVLLVDPTNNKMYHSRAMRTMYKGKLKPFAERLKMLNDSGVLRKIKVPGKHTFVYVLKK